MGRFDHILPGYEPNNQTVTNNESAQGNWQDWQKGPALNLPDPMQSYRNQLPGNFTPIQSKMIDDANPVVGQNLFINNPLTMPIYQNDNPVVKGLKGIGNVGSSLVLGVPGKIFGKATDLYNKGIMQAGSVLSGNGLRKDLPAETSAYQDILRPALSTNANNKIDQFNQAHPVVGGLAQIGFDTLNPMTFIGAKQVKNVINPKIQPDLVKIDLPKNPFSGAFNDVQSKPTIEPKQTITLPKLIAQNATQQVVESPKLNPLPLKGYKINNDAQNAINEISSQMDKRINNITSSLKQADNQTSIESIRKRVKDMGGISQGNADILEEQRVIPNWIRNNKTGRPLDEVANELGMDSNDLLSAINDSGYKPRDYVTEAYRIANSDPEYKALNNTLDALKSELPGARSLPQGMTPQLKKPQFSQAQSNVIQSTKIELPKVQVPKVMAADIEKNTVGNLATQQSYSLSKVVGGNSTYGEPTIPGGVIEHGFGRNVRTDEGMSPAIRQDFTGDPATYTQLANKDTLAKAEARYSKGYEKSLDEWNSSLDTFRADDVPLARLLANEAANRGDLATARKIIDDVSDKLTQAGQFGQAARILRQSSDPGSFMININKQFNKLNEQGRKAYGKKWNDVSLTDDEMNTLSQQWGKLDEEGRTKLTESIYNRINNELPVSKMEKFDTWRRIAMLLNPKTHVRNMIGNTIMTGARKLSDTIAAGMEKAAKIPQAERTKSVGWSKDKSLVDTVQNEWENAKPDLTHVTRWDLENISLGSMDKRIFKSNALNAVDKFSKDTLNMEDNIFLERAYKDALGQFMDARNLRRATPEAREYAKRRAFEATFKQTNKIYEAIVKLKKGDGALSKAVDIAMPFTKTPTNIMHRAMDYSPIGFLKSIYTYKKGKGPALVIEDLSKGMTGTGVTALGFMLASMGWARGEAKSSKNAESITTMSGDQPNSISTALGSYTVDWAQPISVPFAMGVAAYEALKKENPDILSSIYESTAAGINTVFNMTMMSNVQDLLGGGYGGVAEGLMALPSNYVSQAMPTLLGQGARTVDDTKRSTYDPDPKKQFLNTFVAKTPFASKSLLPKLDAFGNEQKQGNAFQQFLSPGYAKVKASDPATNEIVRLYKSTNDTDIIPKVVSPKVSQNNSQIQLTAPQLNEWQKTMGSKNYNDITSLVRSPSYQSADDSKKADMMSSIVRKNYNDTKIELLKKYYQDSIKK